eukprot:3143324-Rhodomonas_salina.1
MAAATVPTKAGSASINRGRASGNRGCACINSGSARINGSRGGQTWRWRQRQSLQRRAACRCIR